MNIQEKDINRFVKHRNEITHDGFYAVDDEMANIAFFMMCFSYFLTLIRIVLKEDEVIYLVDKSDIIS